jgi:hypothetical protein
MLTGAGDGVLAWQGCSGWYPLHVEAVRLTLAVYVSVFPPFLLTGRILFVLS